VNHRCGAHCCCRLPLAFGYRKRATVVGGLRVQCLIEATWQHCAFTCSAAGPTACTWLGLEGPCACWRQCYLADLLLSLQPNAAPFVLVSCCHMHICRWYADSPVYRLVWGRGGGSLLLGSVACLQCARDLLHHLAVSGQCLLAFYACQVGTFAQSLG
jgi:hypothetical protein